MATVRLIKELLIHSNTDKIIFLLIFFQSQLKYIRELIELSLIAESPHFYQL